MSDGVHRAEPGTSLLRDVRVDIARAFERVRERIDAEFGKQEWLSTDDADRRAASEKSGNRYVLHHGGLTFGIVDAHVERVLDIVADVMRPLGFSDMIDSSSKDWFSVDLVNEASGACIHVLKGRGKGLVLQATTGYQP